MNKNKEFFLALQRHYEKCFGSPGVLANFERALGYEFEKAFSVWRFEVLKGAEPYIAFATIGLSHINPSSLIELHLLGHALRDDQPILEALYAVGRYVETGEKINRGHIVNFGRPYLPGSRCCFGLVSRPYPIGPDLELFRIRSKQVSCFWLLPITNAEREFALEHGLEALEQKFDDAELDFLNAKRESVV